MDTKLLEKARKGGLWLMGGAVLAFLGAPSLVAAGGIAIGLLGYAACESVLYYRKRSLAHSAAVPGHLPAAPIEKTLTPQCEQAQQLAMRCAIYRCDQGTLDLAFAIAGSIESLPVRQYMLRFLYIGTPRLDLLTAIHALYCETLPSDIATIRQHTRHVAEVVMATHYDGPARPAPDSFLLYLQGMSDLLARQLRGSAVIDNREVAECNRLVADLRVWGFSAYAEWIAQQIPTITCQESA